MSKKVRAAGENKWNNVKKELFDRLKLTRAVPATNEGDVPLLPIMKDMTNVKVSYTYSNPVDKKNSAESYHSLRRNWLLLLGNQFRISMATDSCSPPISLIIKTSCMAPERLRTRDTCGTSSPSILSIMS